MENYQLKMENEIANLRSRKPELLLHICCAPCGCGVISRVAPYFNVTLYYYNPNIDTEDEYNRRFDEIPKLLRLSGLESSVNLIKADYDHGEFLSASRGFEAEPESGARCPECFTLRLDGTANYAALLGYEYFCTTLTVSPHKNAELINSIGENISQKYGVRWLPSDFKKRDGYLMSVRLSKEYGLYRQCYCGCEFTHSRTDR